VNNHKQQHLCHAIAFDPAALSAIYDDYQPLIYRYIYRQVGEVETTRDLTAEVFRRLLQAIRNKSGPDQLLKAWLYRTAHNVVIDYYRRQQHRRHLRLDETLLAASDDPVALAERQISAEVVRAALQQLTLDQQQVITLKFLEGFSNTEIAEVLDKPVGAVKSLQHRALASLQRQLLRDKEKVLL
jgi:RNA polymerase sigma-70 factor (ECF subfamily)